MEKRWENAKYLIIPIRHLQGILETSYHIYSFLCLMYKREALK